MGLGIIVLKHEVMEVDEWHDNEPQDIVTVLLCIQIAIDKMQLCLLSVASACLYHNPPPPWGTLFTLTSANRFPTQSHLPGTVKTRIPLGRAHLPGIPVAIEGEHFPTEVGYDAKLQSGQDPGEEDE